MRTTDNKFHQDYVAPKYRPPETGGAPSLKRIRRISDADLFKALRLDLPELAAVAKAVANGTTTRPTRRGATTSPNISPRPHR